MEALEPQEPSIPFPPPFGPEEWERMRKLDLYCDLTLYRYNRDSRESKAARKIKYDFVWAVHIHLRNARAFDSLQAIKPTLREALTEALDAAERNGWHEGRRDG